MRGLLYLVSPLPTTPEGRQPAQIRRAWAIDGLGRWLIDLLGTIRRLEDVGVDLYLDQQSIDTTTPAGRLLFQLTGGFAEFERSMIRQAIWRIILWPRSHRASSDELIPPQTRARPMATSFARLKFAEERGFPARLKGERKRIDSSQSAATSEPLLDKCQMHFKRADMCPSVAGKCLFVQAAQVVLQRRPAAAIRALWPLIDQACKRLTHRNLLAIALANKLARIAWAVLACGRHYEPRITPPRE